MPLRRELVAVHFLQCLAADPTEAAVHATGDGPRRWREQAGTQEEMAMMIRAQWTLIGMLLVPAASGLGAEAENGRSVGAYLAEANLQGGEFVDGVFAGANLRDANLQGAYVIGGELAEATLANTNLQGGYLPDANLDDADLQRANLQEVDLQGATLKNADLTGAVLQGANLRGADLGGVRLDGTYLQGASLAGVRGLTQAQLDRACADSTIDLTGTGLRIPRSQPCCNEPGGCGR